MRAITEWRRQMTKNPEDDPIDCTVQDISPKRKKKGGDENDNQNTGTLGMANWIKPLLT